MLLELRTVMLCLVQLSKCRECKATDAEKILSQWEKGAKCNFKSTAQVHERCFFLWNEMLFAMQKTDFHVLELFCRASHVRASMHRITSLELLRTTDDVFSATKQMKRMQGQGCWKASSQWEKVANELFCRASNVRASMHRITGLDLLRTLMLCLVQLSKWRESKATDAKSFSVRESC